MRRHRPREWSARAGDRRFRPLESSASSGGVPGTFALITGAPRRTSSPSGHFPRPCPRPLPCPGRAGHFAHRARARTRGCRRSNCYNSQNMRVLVVGQGAREHAICWKLKQSPLVTEIYAAPGNAGIAQVADCVPIGVADIIELADFAEQLKMDLTIVGPELPLTLGIVDEFQKRGLPIFGPTRLAADEKKFGNAATRILVEEFLTGEEVSFLAITDGKRCVPLAPAKDYKKAFDGDTGPNTGGMGSHSPAVVLSGEVAAEVMKSI